MLQLRLEFRENESITEALSIPSEQKNVPNQFGGYPSEHWQLRHWQLRFISDRVPHHLHMPHTNIKIQIVLRKVVIACSK
jgi:hypothetical protein